MQITSNLNNIHFSGNYSQNPVWIGSDNSIAFDSEGIKAKLLNLNKPCYFIRKQGQIGAANEGHLGDNNNGNYQQIKTLTAIPPLIPLKQYH